MITESLVVRRDLLLMTMSLSLTTDVDEARCLLTMQAATAAVAVQRRKARRLHTRNPPTEAARLRLLLPDPRLWSDVRLMKTVRMTGGEREREGEGRQTRRRADVRGAQLRSKRPAA